MLTVLQRRPPASRRFRRGTYLLPSLFTLANMFCGYACIIYAMRGEYVTAAPFIGVAMVLDMLDGRIARLTKTSSAFGVEFDSLADVISFGVAPAVLALAWGLTPMGRVGWVTGFIYVSAVAIRLARFNIQSSANPDKRYFAGMPCPPAAGVVAATVFAWPYGLTAWHGVLALPLLLVPALLMVSTIRYRSFKTFDLRKRRSYRNLIFLALMIAAIAAEPQGTLVLMAYTYLLSGLVGYAWTRVRRKPESAAPAHDEAARRVRG
ncbi:MAG: CDP-diacylglycerol--serine O-phosphatidyltransferase [Luteitalea sp.]|nr:CDP-diacylglycerol--serine O-phosphatidyltransferase [Luteitalea sp.]